jgi:hypothetical protein
MVRRDLVKKGKTVKFKQWIVHFNGECKVASGHKTNGSSKPALDGNAFCGFKGIDQ